MDDLIKYVTSLGVLGVLGVLVLYIFRYFIPKMHTDFRIALEEQQQQFREIMTIERQTHMSINKELRSSIQALADQLNVQGRALEAHTRALESQTNAFVNALLKK